MKNIVLLFIFGFVLINVSAQNSPEKKYLLTTNSNWVALSSIELLDPYLSDINYSGLGLKYNHINRRFVNLKNLNLSQQSQFNLTTGIALNPANTSAMLYFGSNYGYGMHYHFRPVENLVLLAGGIWDIDFGIKEISRNVNNPVNVDLSTNLNLSGVAVYKIQLPKRDLMLKWAVQSPVLGCMFVPGAGYSYYEMFELGNLDNTFHFSSIHNKRGLNQTFTVEVPFKYSTWQFGLNFFNLKYSANDLVFRRDEVSILIGTTFDAISFSGKKKHAPANFISTND